MTLHHPSFLGYGYDPRLGDPRLGDPRLGDPRGYRSSSHIDRWRPPLDALQPAHNVPPPAAPHRDHSPYMYPPEPRPVDGRPSDGRLSDGRPSDGRPSDGRPSDGRLSDGRPLDGRPSDPRQPESRLPDGRYPDPRHSEPWMHDPKLGDGRDGQSTEKKVNTPVIDLHLFVNGWCIEMYKCGLVWQVVINSRLVV